MFGLIGLNFEMGCRDELGSEVLDSAISFRLGATLWGHCHRLMRMMLGLEAFSCSWAVSVFGLTI